MFPRLRRAFRAFWGDRPAPELDVVEAYARWAPTYPAHAHNALMRVEEAAVLELLPELAGRRVLDLGCGSGRYLAIARDRGAARAVGADLSPDMLRRARDISTSLARADMRATPFRPDSFDVVVCGLAIGHVQDLDAACRELGRLLAPGGIAVYSDFHPFARLAGERRSFRAVDRDLAVEHHLHLYADHQRACSAAGLEIQAVREPRGPNGLPAVLVIRARKLPA